MVSSLRFVRFEVAELDQSIRFYREGLGLRVEEVAPSAGHRTACVEVGEFELVLAQCGASDAPRGTGVRLCLNTHDLDHFAAALQARGVAATAPVVEPWGGRVTTVNDPDGYTLCFVQSRHQMMHDEP